MVLNGVIGGDYKNGAIHFTITGKAYISYVRPFQKAQKIMLNHETVSGYTIIDQNEKKKFGSGLIRGAVGGAAFGVAGAVAGANTAKTKKSYLIEIQFRDGCSSVLELDNTNFRQLIRAL